MYERFDLAKNVVHAVYINNLIQRNYLDSYEDVKFSLNIIGIYDVDFVDEMSEEFRYSYYDMYKWLETFSEDSDWLRDNFPIFYVWDSDFSDDYFFEYNWDDLPVFKQSLGTWVYLFDLEESVYVMEQEISFGDWNIFGEDLRVFTGPLNLDMSIYEDFFKSTYQYKGVANQFYFHDSFSETATDIFVPFEERPNFTKPQIQHYELTNLASKSPLFLMGMTSYSLNMQFNINTFLMQEDLSTSSLDSNFTLFLFKKIRRM